MLNPSADCEIESDFQEILEHKLSRLKELEQEPEIKIEENMFTKSVVPSDLQFSAYTSGNNLKLEPAIDGLDKAEDELLAQVYNSPPEELPSEICEEKSMISNSIFNESPRNFTYSESSNNGTPVLESPRLGFEKGETKDKYKNAIKNIHKNMKSFDDKFAVILDNTKVDLLKEINSMNESIAEFKYQIDNQVGINKKMQETLKENEKKYNKRESGLQKLIENYELRLEKLEKLEDSKKTEIKETLDEIITLKG